MNKGVAGKNRFILIVGEDGAVLTFIKNNKVEKKLFSLSTAKGHVREMNLLLNENSDVPIDLIIDTIEISFLKQTLPAVSSFEINKLAQTRLEKDFSKDDLKGYISLGRKTTGRKDWIFLFASLPLTEKINEWIEYLSQLDNKFVNIHFLPLEMQVIANKLQDKFENQNTDGKKQKVKDKKPEKSKEAKADESDKWVLLITNNKASGFRQVVTKNGKVEFTRLVRFDSNTLTEVIAGNVDQEINNTIDYLGRIGFKNNDKLIIHGIFPQELKNAMKNDHVNNYKFIKYTPFEVAQLLKYGDILTKEDKFADILLSFNFHCSKSILSFSTPQIKKVRNVYLVSSIAKNISLLILLLFLSCSLYFGYKIYSSNDELSSLESEQSKMKVKLKDIEKQKNYNAQEIKLILNFARLYEKISQKNDPITLLKIISRDNKEFIKTKSYKWSLSSKKQAPGELYEEAVFDLDFVKTGQSIEDLFVNFDNFKDKVYNNSDKFEIEMSELPQKITFDRRIGNISVQLKMNSRE